MPKALVAEPFYHHRSRPQESIMEPSSTTGAVHRPGRGRVFDSIVEAVGDTPIVRLRKLPQQHGVHATILAKLEYLNPAASVKDRIGAAMVIAMEKAGIINADTVLIEPP
jgi:cysteine synthase